MSDLQSRKSSVLLDMARRIRKGTRVWLRRNYRLAAWSQMRPPDLLRLYKGELRLMRHLYALEQTKHLGGDIAECGVGSGYSMLYMLDFLQKTHDSRRYQAFDTFEGFPYVHAEDLVDIPEHRKSISRVGHYSEFDLQHMKRMVKYFNLEHRVTFHKGSFEATLPALPANTRFSYVFLDCDLYQSYKTCLGELYDRVLDGGIIVFDEYEHTRDWPGARRAIDEFFATRDEKPQKLPFGESFFVVKGSIVTKTGICK